ncbi:MAG: lysophospholipid acyltransferase family protein [Bacteroidales bacterium]
MNILKSIIVWLAGIAIMLIFLPVTFIVWLLALPFDRNRTITHWLLISQGWVISHLLPIWKISIEGREKAKRGTTYVIICNHQSILDILVLNCLRYKFKWISKSEVYGVPVLGWYVKMADYITVDRKDLVSKGKMIEESYECLKKNVSIMIFPEGTRSIDDYQIGLFKKGAFLLAIKTRTPILSVIMDGTGSVLPKHGIIFGGFHKIDIRVLDPVSPESFGTDDCEVLAIKFQEMMKEELQKLRNERGSK